MAGVTEIGHSGNSSDRSFSPLAGTARSNRRRRLLRAPEPDVYRTLNPFVGRNPANSGGRPFDRRCLILPWTAIDGSVSCPQASQTRSSRPSLRARSPGRPSRCQRTRSSLERETKRGSMHERLPTGVFALCLGRPKVSRAMLLSRTRARVHAGTIRTRSLVLPRSPCR